MRTSTRKWIRTDDVYYDGISFGTPVGQIMFLWQRDNVHIDIFIDEVFAYTAESPMEAMKFANGLIKMYFDNYR